MEKMKSVKYNFIMNFILTASNFLFPLITFPYVSRVLLAAGNGKVAFVTSVASYFMMVASLGIPTYGIRACAKLRDDKEKLSKTVQELLIIHTITTIVTLLLFIASIFMFSQFEQEKELMLINAMGLILNVFGVNWFYSALEQYRYITVRSIGFKLLSIILMFLLVHNSTDYIIYGAILVISNMGSNILNFIRMKEYVSFKRYPSYNFRQHFKPILIFFAQSMAISVYTNLDTVMLGFIKGNVEVGLYSVAIKVKSILVSLVTSLGTVLLPRMSYYISINRVDLFDIMIKKAMIFTLIISTTLSVFFVVMARESVLLLSGPGFLGAIIPMQIILPTIVLIGISSVTGIQILTPLNKEHIVLASVVVGAVVNIVSNTFFIPMFGAAGASFGTLMAQISAITVQIYFVRKIIRKPIFEYLEIIKVLFCALIPVILLFYIKAVVDNVFLSLMIGAILYYASFTILSLLLNIKLVRGALNGIIIFLKEKRILH